MKFNTITLLLFSMGSVATNRHWVSFILRPENSLRSVDPSGFLKSAMP
jgi:hypothetical protein